MTVGELQLRMSSLEVEEWKAYFAVEDERTQRDELAARASDGLNQRREAMRRQVR
jgi:hypothetical protein